MPAGTFLCKRRKKPLKEPLFLFGIILIFLILPACGEPAFQLSLEGSKTLNLDEAGGSLPLVLRVYQLSGKEKISNADFLSLWKSDKEILEGELLERQEITVFPGSVTEVKIEQKKNVEYLAVMALFRDPNGAVWKKIIPLKNPKVKSLVISLKGKKIEIVKLNERNFLGF